MMENEYIKISMFKLIKQVVIRYILILLFVSFVLFLPAGSLKFWNAWIFIGALFLPELFALIYLAIKDPELLQKRLKIKEKEKAQRIFNILYIIIFIITLIITGLDFKYHWSIVPVWLVIVATGIMISGFFIAFIVLKQNSYASRVVEIQEGQKVIDVGLYSVVRHPMYLSALIFFCPMPLVLGSLYAFIIPVILAPFLLLIRIINEEKVLKNKLNGYKEYVKKVKYRLIPFVW
jgi:protein-S-isoprenylcysteine O-methyltransferase Ste14